MSDALLPPVLPDQASDAQRAFLERTPGNQLFRTLAHAPEVAGRLAALGGTLQSRSALTPAIRESAMLRVAAVLGGQYVLDQHRQLAAALGLPGPKIDAAGRRGYVGQVFEPLEQACVSFAESAAAGTGDARAAELVVRHLGPGGLVELAVLAGYTAMLCLISGTLGLACEDGAIADRVTTERP